MSRRAIVACLLCLWGALVAVIWLRPDPTPRAVRESPLAIVEVDTDPAGATVRLDRATDGAVRAEGIAPATFRVRLDAGESESCTLRIEKPGFTPAARQLSLRSGRTEQVSEKLAAIPNWVRRKTPQELHEVRITAVGDILLGEVADPFGAVRQALIGSDITFGNLECPLTTSSEHTDAKSDEAIAGGDQYVFRAHPRWGNELALAGFDVLSLANNHALDYRAAGLAETRKTLDARGIKSVGAGADVNEARALRIVTVGNVQVGFLAASTIVYPGWGAASGKPGVAGHSPGPPERWLTELVTAAKRKVDILCVSFHWGIERDDQPAAYQKQIAATCVKAGASFVIGHHPHCLQPTEVAGNSLVVYSLGNFVGLGTDDKTCSSEIVTACFAEGKLQWYEKTPVKIADHRPALAGEPVRILAGAKPAKSEQSRD